jgi:hypothetical protein
LILKKALNAERISLLSHLRERRLGVPIRVYDFDHSD